MKGLVLAGVIVVVSSAGALAQDVAAGETSFKKCRCPTPIGVATSWAWAGRPTGRCRLDRWARSDVRARRTGGSARNHGSHERLAGNHSADPAAR